MIREPCLSLQIHQKNVITICIYICTNLGKFKLINNNFIIKNNNKILNAFFLQNTNG